MILNFSLYNVILKSNKEEGFATISRADHKIINGTPISCRTVNDSGVTGNSPLL